MALRRPILGLAALSVAFVLTACTGSSASAPPGGSAEPAASAPPAAAAGGGGGGLPGSACALLSKADLQQVLGTAFSDGVEQDSDGQVECDWAPASGDTPAVSLAVATYDDVLWQTGSASSYSSKVDGLGEAAFKGWPTAGTLNIKDKGDMITVGIADFQHDAATVDQEDQDLAKLVLSRL